MAAVTWGGCSSSSDKSDATVTSDDGTATLTIPASALPDGVSSGDISITRDDSRVTAVGGIAALWELEPDGLVFKEPVTLRLAVNIPAGVFLQLEHYSGTESEPLEIDLDNSTVDASGATEIATKLSHFSSVGLFYDNDLTSAATGTLVAPATDIAKGQATTPAVEIEIPSTTYNVTTEYSTKTGVTTRTVTSFTDLGWRVAAGWYASAELSPLERLGFWQAGPGTTKTVFQTFTCVEHGDFLVLNRNQVILDIGKRTMTNLDTGEESGDQSGQASALVALTTEATCAGDKKPEFIAAEADLGDRTKDLDVPGTDQANLDDHSGKFGYYITLAPGQTITVSGAGDAFITYYPEFPPGYDFVDGVPGTTTITNRDESNSNRVLMVLEGSGNVGVATTPGDTPADLCENVKCTAPQWCQPSTGACVDPLPGQGECELHPNSGTCGSAGTGKCILGMCMMEAIMDGTTDGRAVCAAEGLVCDKYPVFVPAQAACLAFHPTAAVTTSANGWRQSVYCNDNTGSACSGKPNTCHDCPNCNVVTDSSGCLQHGSDLYESLFVNCVPAP